MSRTNAKPSKVWLVALPVAVAAAAFGLWTFGRGEPAKPKVAASGLRPAAVDPSLAAIAVQEATCPTRRSDVPSTATWRPTSSG